MRVLILLLVIVAIGGWLGWFARQGSLPVAMPQRSEAGPDARWRYPEPEGRAMMLPGGDREMIHSLLNVPGQFKFGDFTWLADGVPAGPVWVRVDLERQLIAVFRAGHEIGSAVIIYGASNKPTPAGKFTVLEKAQDHYSRSYDAPMPFMLRLTADGVAIHASNVRPGAVTHGCIGVPLTFARKLFAEMQPGSRVYIEAGRLK